MKSVQKILLETSTFILAGGRGSRLSPLTRHRSKPAVPFGDRCIIDFTLSNCLKSNLFGPHVITQYQAAHLIRHVRRWWLGQLASVANASAFLDGCALSRGCAPSRLRFASGLHSLRSSPVCVPARAPEYSGTADALFRNIHLLNPGAEHVLVLSADHIYDMDYRELLRYHVRSGADATVAAILYPIELSRQFGILEVDEENQIINFEEKPSQPKQVPGRPGKVLAKMGIYVFRKRTFLEMLCRDAEDPTSAHDIGRNILANLVTQKNLHVFQFQGYWKDVGTLDSYYEANMEWLNALPGTHRLAGSGSVIADRVRIHRTAELIQSIVMPGVVIGQNARIRRAILDENVRVASGARIGYGDSERAISVIPANSLIMANPKKHE